MKSKYLKYGLIAYVMFLGSGCATMLTNKEQKIQVSTNPEGAKCNFFKGDAIVASVDSTPSVVGVVRSKEDVTLRCEKEGYHTSSYILDSGVNPAAYGNIFFGGVGLVSMAIDSAVGSDNQYPKSVSLTLANQSRSE